MKPFYNTYNCLKNSFLDQFPSVRNKQNTERAYIDKQYNRLIEDFRSCKIPFRNLFILFKIIQIKEYEGIPKQSAFIHK